MGSFGDGIADKLGVAGKDGAFDDVGVGLADSVLVETGNCRERRFGLDRGVNDSGREDWLLLGTGGGSMAVEVEALFEDVVK